MHSSLMKMLESLRLGMTTAEVVCCLDDHFRQAVYSLRQVHSGLREARKGEEMKIGYVA